MSVDLSKTEESEKMSYNPNPEDHQPFWKRISTPMLVLIIVGGVVVLVCLGCTGISLVSAMGQSVSNTSTPQVSDSDTPTAEPTPSPTLSPTLQSSPTPSPTPEPSEPELTLSQEQAIGSAQDYLDFTGFSRSGLIDQLEFEGFSTEDATFAVDYLDVDWMDQAVISAQSYMDNVGGFSRSSLISQLEFEGFTKEQAEHGADEVGL